MTISRQDQLVLPLPPVLTSQNWLDELFSVGRVIITRQDELILPLPPVLYASLSKLAG